MKGGGLMLNSQKALKYSRVESIQFLTMTPIPFRSVLILSFNLDFPRGLLLVDLPAIILKAVLSCTILYIPPNLFQI